MSGSERGHQRRDVLLIQGIQRKIPHLRGPATGGTASVLGQLLSLAHLRCTVVTGVVSPPHAEKRHSHLIHPETSVRPPGSWKHHQRASLQDGLHVRVPISENSQPAVPSGPICQVNFFFLSFIALTLSVFQIESEKKHCLPHLLKLNS